MVRLGRWGAKRGVPDDTLAGSIALGVAVILLAYDPVMTTAGLGLALGLVHRSAIRVPDRCPARPHTLSFLYASLMRLASQLWLAVVRRCSCRAPPGRFYFGVGAAQLVMVAAGVRLRPALVIYLGRRGQSSDHRLG